MESKHSLLKRQLKKYLKNVDKIPEEINELVNVINEAYYQFDTDRKMLERSLELSSQELFQATSEMRAIFQAFPDHLFLIDENGVILDYKTGIIDNLNLQQGNIIGRNIRETPLAEITGLLLNSIKNVLNSQKIKHIEYSLILNESEVFFETRLVPFKNNQVICITRDITSTKLAEIALRMSETKYRT
jgi:PAS domain-containing protein